MIDGMPAEELVQATILEIVIGLVCLFALVRYRGSAFPNSPKSQSPLQTQTNIN